MDCRADKDSAGTLAATSTYREGMPFKRVQSGEAYPHKLTANIVLEPWQLGVVKIDAHQASDLPRQSSYLRTGKASIQTH